MHDHGVSHIIAVNGSHGFESKKTYTNKTKLNPVARDDTLRSKDMKQLCKKMNSIYIVFFYL